VGAAASGKLQARTTPDERRRERGQDGRGFSSRAGDPAAGVGIDSNETPDDMTTSDGHHQKNKGMATTHQCHHDVVGHVVPQSSAAHVVHVHGNAAASFIDGGTSAGPVYV
jgi:hypothetical protein